MQSFVWIFVKLPLKKSVLFILLNETVQYNSSVNGMRGIGEHAVIPNIKHKDFFGLVNSEVQYCL